VEVHLQRGDRFFLLSDGIPEASRANGDPLGYDTLRETLTGIPSGGEWIDTLLDRVRAQVQGIDDDWTAVVLERR
jgi:serine phosphatase RsbU (regulator of sigma subunit)